MIEFDCGNQQSPFKNKIPSNPTLALLIAYRATIRSKTLQIDPEAHHGVFAGPFGKVGRLDGSVQVILRFLCLLLYPTDCPCEHGILQARFAIV